MQSPHFCKKYEKQLISDIKKVCKGATRNIDEEVEETEITIKTVTKEVVLIKIPHREGACWD